MALRRPLAETEIKFARHVFGDAINADNIEVVLRPHLDGGFTPYGSVNTDPEYWSTDYIGANMYQPPGAPDFKLAYQFLHELGHCWQHFVGMPMLPWRIQATRAARRLVKDAGKPVTRAYIFEATYSYQLAPGQPDLLDYTMEQQCEIIADYFSLTLWGKSLNRSYRWVTHRRPTIGDLRSVLAHFLADPKYPMDGRWRGLWRARAALRMANRN